MFCEPIEEVAARPQPGLRICQGCGCTDAAACPGGCHWVSLDPPVCSQCAGRGEMPNAGARGMFFSDEYCPASPAPAVHAPIYIDETTGYCARCRTGFVV